MVHAMAVDGVLTEHGVRPRLAGGKAYLRDATCKRGSSRGRARQHASQDFPCVPLRITLTSKAVRAPTIRSGVAPN